jgi:integrase
MGKLNEKDLKGLIQRPGRYGDGQGLFFKTLGQGRAYWTYRYRMNGREHEMSLGTHAKLSLDEARIRHKQLVADVAKKIDPVGDRRNAKAVVAIAGGVDTAQVPTFGECADRYLDRQEERGQLGKNPKHRAQWRSTLASLPAWFRDLPLDKIGPQQVFDALDPIWALKPETASRLRGRIAVVLDFARGPDDERRNPAAWTKWMKDHLGSPKKLGKIDRKTGERIKRGNHAAMPYQDVPAFMARLKAAPGVAAKALMFLILTAARSGEVFGATFDEIDFENTAVDEHGENLTVPAWLVPAERMKMGVAHRVPLNDAAIEIIKDRLATRDGKQTLVFESPIAQGKKVHRNGGRQPLSVMAMAMTIRRLGAGAFTVHGFRSSFRDWATEVGKANWATAEKCLAHAVGDKSSQSYDRSDRFLLREPLMSAWANYVIRDANVVPLKRRVRAPLGA